MVENNVNNFCKYVTHKVCPVQATACSSYYVKPALQDDVSSRRQLIWMDELAYSFVHGLPTYTVLSYGSPDEGVELHRMLLESKGMKT